MRFVDTQTVEGDVVLLKWQPVANGAAAEKAQRAKTVAVGCDQLRRPQDGKEGVDGSSPSEGFVKAPQIFVDLHFQPGTRPACSIHFRISVPCASSRDVSLK